MASFASKGYDVVDVVKIVIKQTKRRDGNGTIRSPYQSRGGENIYWILYSAIVNAVLSNNSVYFKFHKSIYQVEPILLRSINKFTQSVWFSSKRASRNPKFQRFCDQLLRNRVDPKLILNGDIVHITLV